MENNMRKSITLDEILSLNPQIDEKSLSEAKELLRKLRQVGTLRRGYNLASPYNHRHKPIPKKGDLDPRTVYVGHSPQR